MGDKARNWVYTLHNTSELSDPAWMNEVEAAFINLPVKYGMFQWEVGAENGQLHAQGLLCLATGQRLSYVKKLKLAPPFTGENNAHWEMMKGTLEEAEAYCSKTETRLEHTNPFVVGTANRNQIGQGKRNELATAIQCLIDNDYNIDAVIKEHPHVYAKFYGGIERIANRMKPSHVHKSVPTTLYPWQEKLLSDLRKDADDRKILWFTDYKGNMGKSTMARILLNEFPKQVLIARGKVDDINFAFNDHKIVIFDVARSMAENWSYMASCAENLKNGIIFSGKYESGMKTFAPPHVVFFANFPPQAGLWSDDRLIEVELSEQNAFHATTVPLPAFGTPTPAPLITIEVPNSPDFDTFIDNILAPVLAAADEEAGENANMGISAPTNSPSSFAGAFGPVGAGGGGPRLSPIAIAASAANTPGLAAPTTLGIQRSGHNLPPYTQEDADVEMLYPAGIAFGAFAGVSSGAGKRRRTSSGAEHVSDDESDGDECYFCRRAAKGGLGCANHKEE